MQNVLKGIVCAVATGAAVVVYVPTGHRALAQEVRTQSSGVYSAAQARRGEAVYLQNCTSCHGATLVGAEGGPALVGAAFDDNWSGMTLGDLFEKVRATMPASAPGSLTLKEYADVLAFMLSVGKAPAGATDLPAEPAQLNVITYRKP